MSWAWGKHVPCVALLLAHGALALGTLREHSATVDEGGHLLSGAVGWIRGSPVVYPVNPPLVKRIASIPLVVGGAQMPDLPREEFVWGWVPLHDAFMHLNSEHYQELVIHCRYVIVAMSVLGGCIVYWWSTSLFGPSGGCVSLMLWTFCPNVLSWAGICTADLGATVFGLAAMMAARSYMQRPDCGRAARAGAALGFAALSKFSLLVLYPVFVLACLAASWQPVEVGSARGVRRRDVHALLGLTVSVLVINIGYGFRMTGKPLGSFPFRSAALTREEGATRINRFVEVPLGFVPVPLPEAYLLGLDAQQLRAEYHSPGYLCGCWRSGGWWYFYLYALAIKLPVGTLILGCCAIILPLLGHRYRLPLIDELLLLLSPVAVFVLITFEMRDQYASVRYLLPAFPFAFISIGRLGLLAPPQGRPLCARLAFLVVLAALAWNVTSAARIYPHYMSYFNELAGGPSHGPKHLLESNIDWGQDLLFLKRWIQRHPETQPLGLAYYGGIDPAVLGVDFRLPPVTVEALSPGWYAVSVNMRDGLGFPVFDGNGRRRYVAPGAYTYFRYFDPVDYAGYSIAIFHIKRQDLKRVYPWLRSTKTEPGLAPSVSVPSLFPVQQAKD